MAANYWGLGVIAQTRGDFEQAEELYRKALQINEELGHREEMAVAYRNLGFIAQIRGDFEQAEELYRKALQITRNWGIGRGWQGPTGT